MRKIYIGIVMLFLFSGVLHADGVEDMYMMWTRPNLKQYYILEQEIASKQNKVGPLTYDITYLDTLNYTTYRFSFSHPEIQHVDSVLFTAGEYRYMGQNPKVLYVDAVKGGWMHRYEMAIDLAEIIRMYDPDEPVRVTVYTEQKELQFQERATSNWKKRCRYMKKIFQIILFNKHVPVTSDSGK